MRTTLKVLSEEEKNRIHESTLRILGKTGLRVETARGRQILKDAGAEVEEHTHVVRLPRDTIEEALRLAPHKFTLGARRPGCDVSVNAGTCTLLLDGEGTFALDRHTGERRKAVSRDWLEATRIGDALGEIGVYWSMVEPTDRDDTLANFIDYLRHLFSNFSKHVQNPTSSSEQAPWLLEVLQTIFGDRATIRRRHPLSFLLCPQSPLILDGPHTDAYLELLGWDIPVAIMPMPLMGATAPGSLISTVILGTCEVLGTLCLLQAAAPGTPVIFATALTVMNPRSGLYGSGAVENAILGAATTEMARYYGLPAETSGFSTDQYAPGIQAGYERALNGMLPVLSWPDILVGPGMLGGSTVLSLEQMVIDVEVFGLCRRASQGIASEESKWLESVIESVGPGGHFLSEDSTASAVRGGEWYISDFGMHDSFETWETAGKPTLLDEAREKVDQILRTHQPIPLDEDVEHELDRIQKRAQEAMDRGEDS
jgi:trimethylamine--corrinoid protein Co-methyltransferase